MEELEQALTKYNMGDARTIKEIIAEVDTDHVSLPTLGFAFHIFLNLSEVNLRISLLCLKIICFI